MAKRAHINARVTHEERQLVDAAAKVKGLSKSEFLRRVSVRAARGVLDRTDPKEAAGQAADEARAKVAEARATAKEEHSEQS